jgi:two-component system response regulator NreC
MIRVLVVDDHTILREGICAMLEKHLDIEVVGEASEGVAALGKVSELRPEVVLMDMRMPRLDGLEATRRIRTQYPDTRVIVMTQDGNNDDVLTGLKAGASGCVNKEMSITDVVSAIKAVHQGGSFLCPSAIKVLVEAYLALGGQDAYDLLTSREREVLKLVADGYSNREIADFLSIRVKTAIGHRTNLMRKLNIHHRTGLILYAIRRGVVSVNT